MQYSSLDNAKLEHNSSSEDFYSFENIQAAIALAGQNRATPEDLKAARTLRDHDHRDGDHLVGPYKRADIAIALLKRSDAAEEDLKAARAIRDTYIPSDYRYMDIDGRANMAIVLAERSGAAEIDLMAARRFRDDETVNTFSRTKIAIALAGRSRATVGDLEVASALAPRALTTPGVTPDSISGGELMRMDRPGTAPTGDNRGSR